jgi:hypothetical protein
LIHPALTRLQSRILLGVAKECLYLPAAHLALYDARKVGCRVVGDDVLEVGSREGNWTNNIDTSVCQWERTRAHTASQPAPF